MVVLTDKKLVEMGVSALGARRKMLRVFQLVREAHPGQFDSVRIEIPSASSGDNEGELGTDDELD